MKKFLTIPIYLCICIIFVFFIFWKNLNQQINQAIETGWLPPSIEYYSAKLELKKTQQYSLKDLTQKLTQRNYILQNSPSSLQKGSFQISRKVCKEKIPHYNKNSDSSCLVWKSKNPPYTTNLITFQNNISHSFFKGNSSVSSLFLEPVLFAQHEEGRLRLRQKFKLSETPFLCLQSITLAEDKNFLLHKGASPSGILRAFLRNIQHWSIKEGGSTITQQLIKNRFLSSKRTFRRKIIELIMSLILEKKLTKDQILELYLNTVYMGRTGSYSIYGFASAAQYYFNKPLSRINTAECALLSVMVQSPGKLNPFSHPKIAQKKRNQVLKKLLTNQFISEQEFSTAVRQTLPSLVQKIKKTSGSYFAQTLYNNIQQLNLPLNQDLKINSTLNLDKQKAGEKAVQKALKILDKRVPKNLQKPLETALIHIHLKTNHIQALIGGRNFQQSPFNRAEKAYRPIGSLVKPFVFLSALSRKPSLNPLVLFDDKPFPKKSKWSPKNYKDKYYGSVPLYFALKESLNSISVRLGLEIGLDSLLKDFKKLGLKKSILKRPSITLGAVDLSPMEVGQMYSTIARMGSYHPLSLIESIENINGEVLFQNNAHSQQVFSSQKTAVLIGMMKQVMVSGTAQWVHPFISFPSAGKTGTSNEERDSWFVGFTPESLTVVWVGFDDNHPHGLTGTGGALLIWLYFMQNLKILSQKDFHWPKGTEERKVPAFQKPKDKKPSSIPLIFETKKTLKWLNWLFKK